MGLSLRWTNYKAVARKGGCLFLLFVLVGFLVAVYSGAFSLGFSESNSQTFQFENIQIVSGISQDYSQS